METDIKKKLARNWFKVLQDMICFEIEEIEKSKKKIEDSNGRKKEIVKSFFFRLNSHC